MLGKRKQASAVVALNITSMMDMFTIILVFLLHSFSSEDQDVKVHSDITLPPSISERGFTKTVQVFVSKDALTVEDEVIGKINKGELVKVQVEGNKIVPLFNTLEKKRARIMEETAASGKNADEETVILFMADESVGFDIINKVMKTCGMAGFANFQFAVMAR
ncbi:MAG: biopolymer transporter ExbD [Pseudomonadota bacterium]